MKTLIWFITMCMSATAIGLDVADVNQTLSFEVSEEYLPWKDSEAPEDTGLSPIYAVGVAIDGVTSDGSMFLFRPDSEAVKRNFRSFVNTREVSELQKVLLEERHAGLVTTPHVRFGENGSASRQQLLLAVSVEDAKKMAQAYLDYHTDRYGSLRAFNEKKIEELRSVIAGSEAQLPGLIAEANSLQPEYDALEKITPYHSKEETLSAVAALNTLLNTISVEMSGIRSKIGAIQTYQADKRVNASVQIHLEDMLVEQSIALKAALARKETATGLRDQARRYATLMTSLPKLRKSIESTKRVIPSWRESLEKKERGLRQEVLPHVIDNVATIYPIRKLIP